MRQPVPRLTEDDLSRVVERDFTDPTSATALLAEATGSVSLRAKVAWSTESTGEHPHEPGPVMGIRFDEVESGARDAISSFLAGELQRFRL